MNVINPPFDRDIFDLAKRNIHEPLIHPQTEYCYNNSIIMCKGNVNYNDKIFMLSYYVRYIKLLP